MKFLLFALIISSLISCGEKKTTSSASGNSDVDTIEETEYGLPVIGFHRSLHLNYRLQHAYENLTVNPNGDKKVLGEMPFFLFLSEDNAIDLNFFSRQDIIKVSYLNLASAFEKTEVKLFDKKILLNPKIREVVDFYRDFSYGKSNLESPEQDMLNKVFIVETEEGDLPYVSNMKIMFWVECHGGFDFKNKDNYSCGERRLKFNYKLLDYKLTKRINE